MANRYRFKVGDKVRVVLRYPSASTGVHEHNGEIMTIKALCPFTWAYQVEEYPDQWWNDGCFKKIYNTEVSSMNAKECLRNVEDLIIDLERTNEGVTRMDERMTWRGFSNKKVYKIDKIYNECGIFDWWNDELSMSQLKQMRTFLTQAIKLGFTGYVCFKVGAAGCSHGMWAHKKESTTGYSPDGDCLFHSFRTGDNYFDMKLDDQWMHDKYANPDIPYDCPEFTLAEIKKELKEHKNK